MQSSVPLDANAQAEFFSALSMTELVSRWNVLCGEGEESIKELRPDLIVLDIMLPGIDGLSVLQHIRLEDEKIPILILSAKSGTEDKVKGLAYGVDDYLSKPFNLEEFLLRVERLLTRSGWNRAKPITTGT